MFRPAAVAALAALAACAPRAAGPPREAGGTEAGTPPPGVVDGVTAAALAASGARVVDVRTAWEFAAGHVEGALNVPLGDLARRAAEIGGPETPVVVYCRTGERSEIAAETLRRLGYAKVWDVRRLGAWPRPAAGR